MLSLIQDKMKNHKIAGFSKIKENYFIGQNSANNMESQGSLSNNSLTKPEEQKRLSSKLRTSHTPSTEAQSVLINPSIKVTKQ